jgi:hypothetical protein
MSLAELSDLSQAIAAIAVIASLIVLIIQVRQGNQLARSAAARSQIESLKSISQAMYQTPGLAELFVKANSGQTLSEAERLQITSYLTAASRTWEAMYDAYRQGLIDPDLWEAHRKQARVLAAAPMARAVWALRRNWYSKAYRDFHEADCASTADEKPIDYLAPASIPRQPSAAATEAAPPPAQ